MSWSLKRQNVAQSIFCPNCYITFTLEIWRISIILYLCNFQNIPKRNNYPIRETFPNLVALFRIHRYSLPVLGENIQQKQNVLCFLKRRVFIANILFATNQPLAWPVFFN
jgi:hypothetical protein